MKMRILFLLLLPLALRLDAASAWKAAAVKAIITPEKNLWMAGYSSRKTGAKGKLQDLFAKALVVEDEKGARLAIITLDLIGVPKPLRVAVAREAQAKFKLHALTPVHQRFAYVLWPYDSHGAPHWKKRSRAGSLCCHSF